MKASSKINSIVMSLCEIVIGILLFVNPVGFTKGIIIALGIVLLLMGVSGIVGYFRAKPAEAAVSQKLANGILAIVAGIFCIVKSDWFIVTFPILTVLYGIGTLILGISKVQWTVDMLRLKIKKWYWAAISAVLTVICAVIILLNPFVTTTVLWSFTAVTLIIEAVVDIIAVVIFAKEA